jgi:hypothetical protein
MKINKDGSTIILNKPFDTSHISLQDRSFTHATGCYMSASLLVIAKISRISLENIAFFKKIIMVSKMY